MTQNNDQQPEFEMPVNARIVGFTDASGRRFATAAAAAVSDDYDYRRARRDRGGYSGRRDQPWSPGQVIALIIAVILSAVLIVGFVTLLANGGSFSKDWQSWKEVELAKQTTARAIANSDANARAGFGNDDAMTKQTAVSTASKEIVASVSAPQVNVNAAPAAVVDRDPAGFGVHHYGDVEHHKGEPKVVTNTPCSKDGRTGFRGEDESGMWGCVLPRS
jgi:hypothetical protein